MSHIHVRKIIGNRYQFAGREWWYTFSPFFDKFDQKLVNKYISNKQCVVAKLAKSWDRNLNSEWTVRVFFSAKMILAASLMLANLEYSRENNLQVCIPYLQYYSLLYSLKSLVFVLPNQNWNNGGIIRQSHMGTINVACDEISKISPIWNKSIGKKTEIKMQILRMKAFREMISYRAPSDGTQHGDYNSDVLSLCKVPVELAQMVSEIFENSLHKHLRKDSTTELNREFLSQVYETEIDEFKFYDREDCYRIDYLFRKYPMPTNILHIMSEGHVEDFFGSWCEDEPKESSFNPDRNWRILFDVP